LTAANAEPAARRQDRAAMRPPSIRRCFSV